MVRLRLPSPPCGHWSLVTVGLVFGVVWRGEVPPVGACADGPKDVSDAANG